MDKPGETIMQPPALTPVIGSQLETLCPMTLRAGEALSSECLGQLPARTRILVLEIASQAEGFPRQAKITTVEPLRSTGRMEGWGSIADSNGKMLIRQPSASSNAAFGPPSSSAAKDEDSADRVTYDTIWFDLDGPERQEADLQVGELPGNARDLDALAEVLRNGEGSNVTLREVLPHVAELAQDPQGRSFLQAKLEMASAAERREVLGALLDKVLAGDWSGTIVQKLLDIYAPVQGSEKTNFTTAIQAFSLRLLTSLRKAEEEACIAKRVNQAFCRGFLALMREREDWIDPNVLNMRRQEEAQLKLAYSKAVARFTKDLIEEEETDLFFLFEEETEEVGCEAGPTLEQWASQFQ